MNDLASNEVPAPVAEYCAYLASRLPSVLGDELVGLCLYGSPTIGGFDPATSDLDLLIVVAGHLGVSMKSALIRLLWETAPRVPARSLECWVITPETAGAGGSMRDFEVMVNTHPSEPMTVDGATGAVGVPVVELDLVNETGRSFYGPSPSDLVAAIPRSVVLASMAENLRVETADSSEHYSVLNASRSLAYMFTGKHISKLEGGRWVLARGSAPKVVEEAVQTQMGLAPERALTRAGRRYVKEIMRQLESGI